MSSVFSAWRNSPYPERERYAALFAAMLAFAVGAAFDWFWELADIGAVFFLAGGVVVAARCAQLSQARAAANGRTQRHTRHRPIKTTGPTDRLVARFSASGIESL